MPEIQSGWTVLALAVVLAHQIAMAWIQQHRHTENTTRLTDIESQLTEVRAAYHESTRQLARVMDAVRLLQFPRIHDDDGGQHSG